MLLAGISCPALPNHKPTVLPSHGAFAIWLLARRKPSDEIVRVWVPLELTAGQVGCAGKEGKICVSQL
jgi:hypothetical protein